MRTEEWKNQTTPTMAGRRLSTAQSSGNIGLSGQKKWTDGIEVQLTKSRIDLSNLKREHAVLTVNYQKKKAEGKCHFRIVIVHCAFCLFVG